MSNLARIAQFPDPEEAVCLTSFLQAHGVPALVRNYHHAAVDPALRVALGGFPVMVPAALYDEAATLMRDVGAQSADEAAERLYKRDWFWMPIALVAGTPFLPHRRGGLLGLLQNGAALLCLVGVALWVLAYYAGFRELL